MPGAEHMGREKNAADTKVFIITHSDLLWMNIKKEWIPLLLFKLMVWIFVPIFVVGAGFSYGTVSPDFCESFFCLAVSHPFFILFSWHMEQVLVTALKLWLYCMAAGWQFCDHDRWHAQSTSPCCPRGKCPPGGNGLYQKVLCVTATAPEEARYLHEPEGRCRFFHLVHTGSSTADVWLSFRQPPLGFSETQGSCG